jgi:hypothetical protein
MNNFLQYIGHLKNPLNTERKICKIINLMLSDSTDLFNKLNNSQKQVIMNAHRDIQNLERISNTNFNCSREQLVMKIFNRYKDIYRFHKQNTSVGKYIPAPAPAAAPAAPAAAPPAAAPPAAAPPAAPQHHQLDS